MTAKKQTKPKDPPAHRVPPAFLIYASDDLAREAYFRLSLAERGLLDAIRRACWVSDELSVPADPEQLAIVVRRPLAEVKQALTTNVLVCLETEENGQRLFDAELRKQMEKAMVQRAKRTQNAETTNDKKRRRLREIRQTESVTQSEAQSVTQSEAQSTTLLKRTEQIRTETPFQQAPEVTPLVGGTVHHLRDHQSSEHQVSGAVVANAERPDYEAFAEACGF